MIDLTEIPEQTIEALDELRTALEYADSWQSVPGFDSIFVGNRLYVRKYFSGPILVRVDSPEGYGSRDMAALFPMGREWVALEAWADTTGYECQGGGSVRFAGSRDDAIRFGLSDEGRSMLGLEIEEKAV